MNREPIGLYIFRYIVGFGLFAFMGMLYWSSTLVESDLKALRSDISQLKNDLFSLRLETEKGHSDFRQSSMRNGESQESSNNREYPSDRSKNSSSTSKETYPNLLHDDPFYDTTLPKMLGKGFVPHGIMHGAINGKYDSLHPFNNWGQVTAWWGLCTVTLATNEFGKYETYAPSMAYRIEQRPNSETGDPEFWVFLRDNIYWQPLNPSFFSAGTTLAPQFLRKNQVTADDFKFYYDAMMNPYLQLPGAVALRTYYDAIEEVRVIDKFTLVVRWKAEEVKGADGKITKKVKYNAKQLTGGMTPLASFVYKYFADGKKIIAEDSDPDSYRTNSVWAQNFTEHWAKNIIVSCGAWIFDGMNERQIKFLRNPDYYYPLAALTTAIETDLKDSQDLIWQAFKSNNLDTYNLQPDQQLEFTDFLKSDAYRQQEAKGDGIKRLDYVARMYAYIAWNETTPYFKSAKVRNAMTMAIDRRRLIEHNLNGMGIEITGTFYPFSPANDPAIKPLPFNPQQARRLLEEEGWHDINGDGILDKEIDGKIIPFSFSLTYYVKNATTKSICEYVATALKEIGVDCRLNGVDVADLSSKFDDKGFDALTMFWGFGSSPENPRQLWSSAGAKERGSSNAIGFANSEIDKIIDELDYEYDLNKRVELYHRFDAILHAEQPYTFLYTPKVALIYRDYLQNVFLPVDRQDLIPGANVAEPASSIFWIKKK